jgi:hypothetical protein
MTVNDLWEWLRIVILTEMLKSQGRCYFTIVKRKGYCAGCNLTVFNSRAMYWGKEKASTVCGLALSYGLRPALPFCYVHVTESTKTNMRQSIKWQYVHSLVLCTNYLVKMNGINSVNVMYAVGLSKKMANISESWLCHNMDICWVAYFIGHFISFHSTHDTYVAVRKTVDVYIPNGNSWM